MPGVLLPFAGHPRRLPTLRLATGLDQLPFKHDRFSYGIYELPVTWRPGRVGNTRHGRELSVDGLLEFAETVAIQH